MSAVYNEIDPTCVRWLEGLIAAGHIAPGRVDERSIAELRAADVAGPGQRHFFAGIAGWSLALRLAGLPDDAPIWTGSCPCQPLSVAGLQRGAGDARHLWPVWYGLIAECRPPVLFGEQVAGAAGVAWLTAVRADLEGLGYAVGAADLAAASVGAPHIRQRLIFGAVRLADGDGERLDWLDALLLGRRPHEDRAQAAGGGEVGGMADSPSGGRGEWRLQNGEAGHGPGPADGGGVGDADREHAGRIGGGSHRAEASIAGDLIARARGQQPCASGRDDGVGDAYVENAGGYAGAGGGAQAQERVGDRRDRDGAGTPGTTRSPWSDLAWIPCRDGKSRPAPAQPSLHPLAHGVPGRVGQLRAAGNAIVPQVAAEFVGSFLDGVADLRRAT